MNSRFGLLLLFAAMVPTAAVSRIVEVEVDAGAGPWSTAVNADRMPYGAGDEKPPVVIPFDVAAGGIGVLAKGTTGTADRADIPPAGIEGDAVDDKLRKKRRYPSFYAPKLLYPIGRHALIAAFVDAKGVVVSRAVPIGNNGIRLPIPDNAVGLALGFNDVNFTGNRGKLKVLVEIPD